MDLMNYVITDNFPANTTYVPSSAKLTYDSSALSVAVISGGTGVSGTIPTLAIDKIGSLCFRVTVN
ncbi:hypothetical protein GCM10010844_41760 [Deinococcus radiotolerans]|uniref:Uncharacterized protein n=2 Tax=Deinococcus radiotolerans TaxID=1309407 RepID=A0ABQ2FR22_9DEIO|nr:hypothetical protein GCM10010844_41760 [Deinococcus radiotolerans]